MLLFLIADATRRQPHINRLFDIIHGLTTIYNVSLVNETSLYTAFMQKPGEKILVVFFNEDGLGNRQFRECFRTTLAAKTNIIGILDEGMTKERVLSFFFLGNKRRRMLEEIVTNAVFFERDTLFRATPLVDRIQKMCRPLSSRLRDCVSASRLPKIVETPFDLEACLKSHKVVLKPMIRCNQHHHSRSTHLITLSSTSTTSVSTSSSSRSHRKTQFPLITATDTTITANNNKEATTNYEESIKYMRDTKRKYTLSSASSSLANVPRKGNKTPQLHSATKSSKQKRCFSQSTTAPNNAPNNAIRKDARNNNHLQQQTTVPQSLPYPTIEISHDMENEEEEKEEEEKEEEGNNVEETIPDKITENQKCLPWTITPNKPTFVNINNDIIEGSMSLETNSVSDPLTRRFSFDYISKTYVVFDPQRKKTLRVNFPYGADVLKRDSLSDIITSAVSSRRSSLMFSNSLSSSIDEINLESVENSINIFDSPIPSPIMRRRNVIYQDPLPAFPADICFPPLERFPCETFQKRRPSVFDVLLHH